MAHSLATRVVFSCTKTRNTTKNNNNMKLRDNPKKTNDKPNIIRSNSQAPQRTRTHNNCGRRMKIRGGGRTMKISHPLSYHLKTLHQQQQHVNFLKISRG
jgi:hypothetical protein